MKRLNTIVTAMLAALIPLCLLLLPACSSDDELFDDDETAEPTVNLVGAQGVSVTSVAIYQGPKRVLAENGAAAASDIPIIAGRDALVRIFYTSDAPGKTVTGRLTIAGQDNIEVQAILGAASTEGDINSTVNFILDGSMVGETFDYSVGLLEDGTDDNTAARYPMAGTEAITVEGKRNTLRIVLVPFQYNADGSGRIPDVSEAGLEGYRQRFRELYPVSDVEVTATDPVPWSGALTGNGTGWQEAGFKVYSIKMSSGMSPDVYHVGIFNPAETLGQFCGGGCLLGVTLLNDMPPDIGNPDLRLALAVGFPEVTRDTTAHEVGHAHGRKHVNCGPGLDPNSIDQTYPHDPNTIGPWSWNINEQKLLDPGQYTDMMGYCQNRWISDHNYKALHARGQAVNLPQWQGPKPSYDVLALDGQGRVTNTMTTTVERPMTAAAKPVSIVKDGIRQVRTGHFYAYDHLPGGWLFTPSKTTSR